MQYRSLNTARRRLDTLGLLGALIVVLLAACSDGPTPPPVPVASVQVAPDGVLLQIGSSQTLSATPRAADGRQLSGRRIEWSSNREEVASVDAAGRVTAHAAGEATITARSEGRSGSAQITVRALSPVPQLAALSPSSTPASQSNLTLAITGSGFTPDARVRLSGVPRPATFVSETELHAHLTSVDIGRTGTFEVTVVNLPPGGGVSNALTFTVTEPPPPVATVVVSPGSTAILGVGEVRQFSATTHAADGSLLSGRAIAWSSSDPLVASVDGTGRVTAHREGLTMILATSEGRTGSATVRVITWQPYSLYSAAGSPLPADLYITTTPDDDGVVRYLRTVATGGSFRIGAGRYEQRLTLVVYMESTVVQRITYVDRGAISYDVATGEPIFTSELYQNVQFRGSFAANEQELEIAQVVGGEGPAVTFRYRRD